MTAATDFPQYLNGSPRAVSGRLSWAFQRRRERSERRERLAQKVYRPTITEAIFADPLLHAKTGFSRRFSIIFLLVTGSLFFHLFFLFGSLLVNQLAKAGLIAHPENAPIQVAIENKVEVKKPPAARELPKPINPVTAQKVEAPPPRRIVGLSMDSTVAGGSGPSFAVGNTLMGKTERVAQNISGPGNTFTPPVRARLVKPVYPAALKASGVEADVVLEVNIDERGQVTGVTVVEKSSYPEFDEAAVASAWRNIYEPAKKNGVPVPMSIKYTVQFRLRDL